MQSVRPMRSHGPLSRLRVVASAIWILFWAWRFASGCDVLADTLACLGVNVEGTVSPKGSSLERLARLVALMFGAPLVACVLGAAYLRAYHGFGRPSAGYRDGRVL